MIAMLGGALDLLIRIGSVLEEQRRDVDVLAVDSGIQRPTVRRIAFLRFVWVGAAFEERSRRFQIAAHRGIYQRRSRVPRTPRAGGPPALDERFDVAMAANAGHLDEVVAVPERLGTALEKTGHDRDLILTNREVQRRAVFEMRVHQRRVRVDQSCDGGEIA